MRKTALVVDDSRVAVMGLARLLRARGFLVDTAESGPEALDYLRLNPPPAALFLDHMMPGMDGFEVLATLKSDARLSAIPVVMYTSQEDANYMHAARALGAMDVLTKPPSVDALDRLLTTLHVSPSPLPVDAAAWPARNDDVVPASSVASIGAPVTAEPARGFVMEPARSTAWIAWALCLMFAAAAIWFFAEQRDADQALTQAQARIARLETELAQRERDDSNDSDISEPALLIAEPTRSAPTRPWLDAIAWAVNQSAHYGYGEVPFGDERLRVVRELITRLTALGFHGTVRLEAHSGDFCLSRASDGRHRLPEPSTPFAECEVVAPAPAEAARLAERQSLAFARYLGEVARPGAPVAITIVSHGNARPQRPYPDRLRVKTAGEWNAIAEANQRIDVALLPAS